MQHATLTLPAALESVSRARRFLQDTLAGWGADGYEMAAPQVLTELAANAALHARGDYTVDLRLEPAGLLVQVTDSSPVRPQPRRYGTGATTGRGLTLVQALSVDWGVADAFPSGKTVWCRVSSDDLLPDFLDVDDLVDADDVEGHVRTSRGPGAGGVLVSAA